MKTAFFNIAALAFATISGAVANPAPNGMAVDISERDGVLEIREVRLAFNAESVFISVVAAPLETVAAMHRSMLVAVGVETTASLVVLEMDRLVSSGVSKFLWAKFGWQSNFSATKIICNEAHMKDRLNEEHN
ncbi:hypothetical protein NW762_003656 [Fusarium torreyae]|uniref:Uncharacterized protein n=1 Tax=Fusarium torreyae TaxID=1237075 RepID=A0A9W8S8Y2_9HYPO|nr:hypothetical protein NW762_003656 [Fusarium torreyae]